MHHLGSLRDSHPAATVAPGIAPQARASEARAQPANPSPRRATSPPLPHRPQRHCAPPGFPGVAPTPAYWRAKGISCGIPCRLPPLPCRIMEPESDRRARQVSAIGGGAQQISILMLWLSSLRRCCRQARVARSAASTYVRFEPGRSPSTKPRSPSWKPPPSPPPSSGRSCK